jgi:cytochrome c
MPRSDRAWSAVSALLSLIVAAGMSLGVASASFAQEFGLGRPPTPEEIRALDISIPPSGEGLPPGDGTAEQGRTVFEAQCVRCHGATGVEGPKDVLVGGAGTLATADPLKTVGSYWPYATTLWDYVNRAMPLDRPGALSPNDVYAAVAFILQLNGVIAEGDVIDATTLPAIRMPNRDGFVPDDRPDVIP